MYVCVSWGKKCWFFAKFYVRTKCMMPFYTVYPGKGLFKANVKDTRTRFVSIN